MKNAKEKSFLSRYRPRQMRNPFFPKRERPKPWKKLIFTLALLFILFVSFVFLSPTFVITDIIVEGTQTIEPEIVQTETRAALTRRSYVFLYDKNALIEHLTKTLPIETLEVTTQYPNALILSINERLPFAILESGGEERTVDRTGIIMQNLATELIQELNFRMIASEPISIGVGERLFSETKLNNIKQVRELIAEQTPVEVTAMQFTNQESDSVQFVVNEGWLIYVDLTKNISQQTTKLATVLRDSIEDRSVLEYVDLRFEDRVYFK